MANGFTKARVLKAVRDCGGFMDMVRKQLGVKSWATARKWVNKWPETRAAFDDHRERLLDAAELTTQSLMKSPDDKVKFKASTYVLDRLGRDRGYGEHIESDVTTKIPDMSEAEKNKTRKKLAKDIAVELKKKQ